MNAIIREALRDYVGTIRIREDFVTDLRYADDIALLAESIEEANAMMERIERTEGQKYKMNINITKKEIMKIGRLKEDISLHLDSGIINQVTEFKYLGGNFTSNNDTYRALLERIRLGYAANEQARQDMERP